MRAIAWIAAVWNALPDSLRRFLGIGIATGTALVMVIAAFLFWGTGYVQQHLGIVTKQDVMEVEQAVEHRSEDELNMAIHFVAGRMLTHAMDSARAAQDSLFDKISREVLEPGIERQNYMMRQIERLSARVGLTNEMLQDQRNASVVATDRIGELKEVMQRNGQGQKLDQIIEHLELLNRRQDQLEERLPKKMKF